MRIYSKNAYIFMRIYSKNAENFQNLFLVFRD